MLQRHGWLVWRKCWLRAHGDRERCRDLVQEVSAGLWLRYGSLREGSTTAEERAWVRWVTRSVLDHQTRRQQPEVVPLSSEMEETVADTDDNPLREQLDECMAALGDEERRIVQLRLDGYRADEIAEQMGLARDAVYQRIHRAIAKMRAAVLMVLLLLVSSAVAVALVPQWRMAVFGNSQSEEPQAEPAPVRQEPVVADTVAVAECPTCRPDSVRRRPVEKIEKITAMPVQPVEPHQVEAMQIIPQVKRVGNRVIVSGVNGERVTIYDAMGEQPMATTICNGVCVFYDIPGGMGFSNHGEACLIKIGDRPMVAISSAENIVNQIEHTR